MPGAVRDRHPADQRRAGRPGGAGTRRSQPPEAAGRPRQTTQAGRSWPRKGPAKPSAVRDHLPAHQHKAGRPGGAGTRRSRPPEAAGWPHRPARPGTAGPPAGPAEPGAVRDHHPGHQRVAGGPRGAGTGRNWPPEAASQPQGRRTAQAQPTPTRGRATPEHGVRPPLSQPAQGWRAEQRGHEARPAARGSRPPGPPTGRAQPAPTEGTSHTRRRCPSATQPTSTRLASWAARAPAQATTRADPRTGRHGRAGKAPLTTANTRCLSRKTLREKKQVSTQTQRAARQNARKLVTLSLCPVFVFCLFLFLSQLPEVSAKEKGCREEQARPAEAWPRRSREGRPGPHPL